MLDLPVKGMAQKGKGIGLYKRGQPIDIACLLVMGNQGFMNRLRLLLNCAKKKDSLLEAFKTIRISNIWWSCFLPIKVEQRIYGLLNYVTIQSFGSP